jgi:hypothetical protein
LPLVNHITSTLATGVSNRILNYEKLIMESNDTEQMQHSDEHAGCEATTSSDSHATEMVHNNTTAKSLS